MRSVLQETGAKTVVLAAASHFESTREQAFRVNVTGTQTVINACRQARVRRFVYVSTTAAIFTEVPLLDAREDSPYVQDNTARSFYGLSKAKGELICMDANGKDGMHTTAVRPASFTGPGDTTVIPQAIHVLKSHHAFIQIGDDKTVCDWDSVHNVSLGTILAMEKLLDPVDHTKAGVAAGEIFHISCEEPYSVFEYMRKIWFEYNGYKARYNLVIPYYLAWLLSVINEAFCWIVGAKPAGLTRATVVYATASRHHNIDKAKRLLGYKPIQTVDEHLKEAVSWYKEEEAKQRLAKAKAKMVRAKAKRH